MRLCAVCLKHTVFFCLLQNEALAPEIDQDSACSADVSNTDSGRGSNEDCSHDRIRQAPAAAADDIAAGYAHHRGNNNDRINQSLDSATPYHHQNRAQRNRNSSESSVARRDSWQIRTAQLHAGAYPSASEHNARRSFNAKNISHPSPLLGDPLCGDRRRNVLYRDLSHSPHTVSYNTVNYAQAPAHSPSNASQQYVMLSTVGTSKNKLHEVHV